ncbi:MAG TPA: hypothetical protein VE133_10030, partial [Candidatus Sulfotelmatobacter sp.]|nr:hypothetical protein [Candidatus Sulfotelmatobacter sp.]
MPKLPKISGSVPMKILLAFITLLSTGLIGQTTSSAITDPAQITSKQKFDIQPFTIEKLYMTRAIGDSSWSSD